jgi:hypothetical protein
MTPREYWNYHNICTPYGHTLRRTPLGNYCLECGLGIPEPTK